MVAFRLVKDRVVVQGGKRWTGEHGLCICTYIMRFRLQFGKQDFIPRIVCSMNICTAIYSLHTEYIQPRFTSGINNKHSRSFQEMHLVHL